MTRLKVNNTPFFVTVLSACLGLVAAGVPARAHQRASSVLSEIAATACANGAYLHSSNQSLKLTAVYNSHPLPDAFESDPEPPKVQYKNRNPLASNQQILVVTRMPRASLDA